MTYEIVYDEKYIAPGLIIYRTDYKQFLKIMPNINDKVNSFTLIASDDIMDNTHNPFRHIIFGVGEDSSLYTPLKQLQRDLNDTACYSIYPKKEGYNQVRIRKIHDKLLLQMTKDLTHSLNLNYNAMSLTIAGSSIGKFYNSLKSLTKQESASKVLEKMINLTPTK
jgi:hypothetical protein